MDDVYKIFLAVGAGVAALGSIGIIGVVGEKRDLRKIRVRHQARASEVAGYGWHYQARDGEEFLITGNSRDGIGWELAAEPYYADVDGGSVPATTTWACNLVSAPYVQLCVMPRSEYKHAGTWLGSGMPPLVKLFCEGAREIPVPGVDEDYVVLAADETLGYQVFGPETQQTYAAWLSAWRRVKSWGDHFTIRLGGRDLRIEANEFLNATDTLKAMADLGEALARAYLKFLRREMPRLPSAALEPVDRAAQVRAQIAKSFYRGQGTEISDEEARYLARSRFPIPLVYMILGLGFFVFVVLGVIGMIFSMVHH